MDDLISREKAIEEIKAVFEWHDTVTMERMIEHFNNLPSAQPDLSSYSDKLWRNAYERGRTEAQPEIVHCKDCKWKQGAECVRFAEIRVFPDDFCSRAERREE